MLQVVLAVFSPIANISAASLTQSPGTMARSTRSSLVEAIEFGEGLARDERWHHDRVLHEDCHHSPEGPALAFSAREREDGGN